MHFFRVILIFSLFFSVKTFADDEATAKKRLLDSVTSKLSSGLENLIKGEGESQVTITAGEDYHPEYSIATVRPLAPHPGVDAWFVQLQLNEHKIRGDGRISVNTGIGYRKLSDNKHSLTGFNVFLDYDAEGNARTSIGLELRSSAFEAIGNYYAPITGGKTVGGFTERSLGGLELEVIGELPYLPWASIVGKHYEWQAEKNAKDSKGDKISLELTITPNLIVDLGYDDNNIDGTSNFASIMFVCARCTYSHSAQLLMVLFPVLSK